MKIGSTFVGLNGYIVVSHMDMTTLRIVFRVQNRRHCQVNLFATMPKDLIRGLQLVDESIVGMRLGHAERFWFYSKLYAWVQDSGVATVEEL